MAALPTDSTWIAPAAIATVIASFSSGIVAIILHFLSRTMQRERFENDRTLAREKFDDDRRLSEEKFDNDRKLAERKNDADIHFAREKLSADLALAAWQRKVEFAEEFLRNLYEASDMIKDGRAIAALMYSQDDRETRDNADNLINTYSTCTLGIRSKRTEELFKEMQSTKYRIASNLGEEVGRQCDRVLYIYNELLVADKTFRVDHDVTEFKKMMGLGPPEDPDPIMRRLDEVINAIEKTCRPILQGTAP